MYVPKYNIVQVPRVSLKTTLHVRLPLPKQRFIATTCDSKSRAISLWGVINKKLNLGNKIIIFNLTKIFT